MVTKLLISKCDSIDSDEKELENGDSPTAHMTRELSGMERVTTEKKSKGATENIPMIDMSIVRQIAEPDSGHSHVSPHVSPPSCCNLPQNSLGSSVHQLTYQEWWF